MIVTATTTGFNPQGSPVCLSLTGLITVLGVFGLQNQRFYISFLLHPASIKRDNAWYRLVSGDFVHNDLVHLLINAFAFFAIGSELEEYLRSTSAYGSLLFLVIYISSCFCGSFITFWKYRNDFTFSSAGASGSILGCMLGFMILQPYHVAFYLPVFGAVMNIYTALIYMAVLISYRWRSGNPMVSYEVHLYGAMGGIIATLIIMKVPV
jgi:membrane associated rhomboid family serine protease